MSDRAGWTSAQEQCLPPRAKPGMQARATQAFAGLNQRFHRDYLGPTLQSAARHSVKLREQTVRLGTAAGQSFKHGVEQSWSDSVANLPSGRATLAAVGQTLQQVASCGLSTLAAEVAFMHAYSLLANSIAQKNPQAALGLQAVVSMASIASHVYVRHPRMDRLGADSTVRVRGHFGLSPQDWSAKLPAERKKLSHRQQQDSRNVTRNQVVAEVMYLGIAAMGVARGDGALSARVIATQLRHFTYAVSREGIQASISMTGIDGGKKTYGVNEDNMATMGWIYSAMTMAMGFVRDSICQDFLPAGQTLSRPDPTDANQQPLPGVALAKTVLLLAGTRSGFNTLISIMDEHVSRHLDAKQSGATQIFQPSLPLKDYGRVLDQSLARMSWSSLASAANMAMGELVARESMTAVLGSFLSNGATAAAMGLAYRTINQTFQAHAAVRKAIDNPPVPD
jgi:hypothetical protein